MTPQATRKEPAMDLLRVPIIGGLLRWRHCRLALQLAVAAAAAAVILHGLLGPQVAPRNLDLFCTACPMVLARDAGRRMFHAARPWPARLRGKWLAFGLLVAVLFTYELFDLWARPGATAWLVLGYFALALAVDLTFRGAAFCKYVCPIGQFNFLASTLAPAELQVRDISTCRTCRTSDCIKGHRSEAEPLRIVQRGCELGLFLPAKVGNVDCTLCLDCVRACPHDNIALATRVPGLEILETRRRSGIGRLANRPDIIALAIVFTFGALLSAFVMTSPAAALERWLMATLGVASETPVLALLYVIGLGAVPLLLLSGAAAAARRLCGPATGRVRAAPYVLALMPLGCGVWLAHYGFHFLTGALTIVPVSQAAAIDLFGRAALGEPLWQWVGMQPGSVFPLQLGVVSMAAVASIALVHATAARDCPARPAAAASPWQAVVVALAAAALWILWQPMEMRGLGGLG
jgi:ferredoxin